MSAMSPQQQQLPARRFSPAEIELTATQAGERARLQAKQQNDQVAAKLIEGPSLSAADIKLAVKHATEVSRLRAQQNNERYDMDQAHEKAGQALLKTQAAERKKEK